MQQLHKQVEGQVDTVVGSLIEAVVPTLNDVVGSYRQHVDRPRSRGHTVLEIQLFSTYWTSVSWLVVRASIFETLEFWQNSGFRQERQHRQLSDVLVHVGMAVSPVGWF